MAILLISSEIEELVGLSHRVVVMARGRTIAELKDEAVQEERVLHAAFDSESQRAAGQSA
jgi:ABC-type sugar transport system ATPase subunit